MAKLVSAAAFVSFLQARLAAGDGYIMCATGQNPKSLSDWWFTGQYAGAQLEKARYWRAHAARVWDCNGLAEGYYKDMTGVDINTRARNNYSEWCDPKGSGTIPVAYRVPGAAVFKHNGSYIHHVGYLVEPVKAGHPEGDWYVIEAKGVMYGVVQTRLLGSGWNRWGLMTKYYAYDTAADVTTEGLGKLVLGDRVLKKGCVGEDVRQLQTLLMARGFDCGSCGADGDFGPDTKTAVCNFQLVCKISTDGVYGEETHAALMALVERDEDAPADAVKPAGRLRVTASVSAYVRAGAGTGYGIVTAVRRGAEFAFAAVSENGWRAIDVNGRVGWISPRMCEVV